MMNEQREHKDKVGEMENWEAFRLGDRQAFECIYRRNFQDLYKYGMTIHPNQAAVRDAIQELFVDLWHYKNKLSNIKQLKYYLLKSLRFKIYRHINQKKRHNLVQGEFEKESIRHLPSQEEKLIASDTGELQKQQITLVINELPERQREAIMLIFFEERTYEETATIMSMTVQSVYTLIWRAIATLKKKLNSSHS